MFSARAVSFTLAGSTSVRNSSGKLKELGIRLKSIANIQKITKTMNMISAAKYARAAKELEQTRSFGAAGSSAVTALTPEGGIDGNKIIVMCSSDRGLCGALHTNLARAGAETLRADANCKAVCVGDKNRISLTSMKLDVQFLLSCKEIGRNNPTFADATAVSQAIIDSDYDWKTGSVLYNWHKSAMTQNIESLGLASEEGFASMPGIEGYDSVDEDVLKSFTEFALASTLYGAIKENYVSEQAARMIAMDGASKNATDMIERMTLQYNRLRQAVITTELCEIIAGMAAL